MQKWPEKLKDSGESVGWQGLDAAFLPIHSLFSWEQIASRLLSSSNSDFVGIHINYDKTAISAEFLAYFLHKLHENKVYYSIDWPVSTRKWTRNLGFEPLTFSTDRYLIHCQASVKRLVSAAATRSILLRGLGIWPLRADIRRWCLNTVVFILLTRYREK